MNHTPTSGAAGLPAAVELTLTDLVAQARECLQGDLRSVVLFGSGAEGRLRSTSDLNVLFVLRRYEQAQVDSVREALRLAHVTHRVAGMFLLETELAAAAEVFAVKFDDMKRRHRVLWGEDLLGGIVVSPELKRLQLRQVLLNLLLRLRERYAMLSLREEQLAIVLAEVAGPLRAAAATLLDLEGNPPASPRAALEQLANSHLGAAAPALLALITSVRESRTLPAGEAGPALFRLMGLVESLLKRAEARA